MMHHNDDENFNTTGSAGTEILPNTILKLGV